MTTTFAGTPEIIVSADSHVMESHEFWKKHIPDRFSDPVPEFPPPQVGVGLVGHPGGSDPHERVKEMAQDGVSAEVLYPTLGLRLFGLDDAKLQEECFRVYNDWLIEYCAPNTDRLIGIPCIAIYDVNHAVKELERCYANGLKGALIWQVPHPDLPFYSEHYNPFWEAAQALNAPISLHILTGHNYSKGGGLDRKGPEAYRGSVNLKTFEAMNALFDLIWYGILDRYPDLKFISVENEIGWIPFVLQQWDYYYRRFLKTNPTGIEHEPSFYFYRNMYATFFNDAVGGHNLAWWGHDNCMWSNDFPHPNSTWPNSLKVIERDLGHLPPNARAKLVRENVIKLYGMKVPQPV